MLRTARVIGICLLLVVSNRPVVSQSAAPSSSASKTYISWEGALEAIVLPAGKARGFENYESRVEIRRRNGALLQAHDFSSADGEHGYGVAVAQWTPDTRFFVFSMRNSGGHSPMYAPVAFWSRRTNRFYQLNNYTASQILSVESPDKVKLSTWPDMKPVTISLRTLPETEVTVLQPAGDNRN